MIGLLLAFLVSAGPLSKIEPRRLEVFVPVYATAVFVTDLITAVVLFALYSVVRTRGFLILANGYLFAALIVIPWMLTFPGVFAPGGLLGAGMYTAQWLYNLRHLCFPLFVIFYALLKDADPSKRISDASVTAGILPSVVVTITLVCAATLVVTAGHSLLPHTMRDSVHASPLRLYVALCEVAVSIAALVTLWVRMRSVLDLWLMIVIWAYVIEVCVVVFPTPERFNIGWYAGRFYGLISSGLVLVGLLNEITALYGQLLRAILAQRREREMRLMTGDALAAAMAHEIRQPLTAMTASADAALNWLDRSEPDIDSAKASLKRISTNGIRVSDVIGSIRSLFKSEPRNRTSFNMNELIDETVNALRSDLLKHRISVQADTNRQLLEVRGDRGQLQQVLFNLIGNAIDSMACEAGPRILSIKSGAVDGSIMVAVADSGKGIPADDVSRIFSPLFTTKSGGMGLGLAICRSIIEAHNGRLWTHANTRRGAVFQFVLPMNCVPFGDH